jgi:hypothetical protein
MLSENSVRLDTPLHHHDEVADGSEPGPLSRFPESPEREPYGWRA